MVNDIAKLAQSVRESVVRQRAKSSLQQMPVAEKERLRDELNMHGQAVYSDSRGNRYRIERKPQR